ncbi:MAG TPA: hypothetical protein VEA80_03540 [Vitreimonas sp.]|uniref:CC_3452 family protein n=1 Tax=Vitreimonas sp. TaxID=3069702 RepID=UPI002D4AB7F2|nr:hypothetical protein [Vitreimonas sp.]HYD86522.1 hypothetical protein [Vitreimonas sp.]
MSALRSIVIAALASMSFAGAASARDVVFTVQIEGAAAERQVIAQNTVWLCEGDTCRARPNHAASVRACRQIARELGGARILAYGPEGGELTADELARCNGDAAPAVTHQAQN